MVHSLGDFARDLIKVGVGVELWKREILEEACKKIEKEAKDVIGTYRYEWPQLADKTQADRVRQGYAANEPLLRTGDLRDSIEHTVVMHESAGYVGSNDKIAVYQELGTKNIPPRSFIGGAARAKEHEIHEDINHGLHVTIAAGLGLTPRLKRG